MLEQTGKDKCACKARAAQVCLYIYIGLYRLCFTEGLAGVLLPDTNNLKLELWGTDIGVVVTLTSQVAGILTTAIVGAAAVLASSAGVTTRGGRRTASSHFWHLLSGSATSSRHDTLSVRSAFHPGETGVSVFCIERQGQAEPVIEEDIDILSRTLARDLASKGDAVRLDFTLSFCLRLPRSLGSDVHTSHGCRSCGESSWTALWSCRQKRRFMRHS